MITGATYQKLPLLRIPAAKKYFLEVLFKGCEKYKWTLEDWVVLDNHYHIMLDAPDNSENLPGFINGVHKFTALWIKKNVSEAQKAQKIFYNYWDSCITYERSYFTRLNYIHFNPIKHGYTKEAEKYEFGSYRQKFLVRKKEMLNLQKKYPWNKVKLTDSF
ncbi:MAG: transposase [Planctomycetes bacterium]|nr:transposase [Planctomycetota bacterium]